MGGLICLKESEKLVQQGLKALVKDKFIIVVDSSIDNPDIYEIRSNKCV